MTSAALTAVPVTTVWISPDRVRDVDAPAVADLPDAGAWLALMDAHPDDDESGDGRLGLHGRVETQLVEGEPVVVTGTSADGRWSRVLCPWQPHPGSPDGYPGWVPTAHLRLVDDDVEAGWPAPPAADVGPGTLDADHPTIALARPHIGLLYLWGGTTARGFDCSGLVHQVWRRLGRVVPRDAWAQAEAAQPVDPDAGEPGDLYFFAHPGRRIHHVGIVVAPGRMVHASETGGVLVEEALGPDRVATLVGAGRFGGA